MRTIVAIPLLAAIWFGLPASAAAQDPPKGVRPIGAPVITEIPRGGALERIEGPGFKQAIPGESPAPVMADQRRGGGGGGGGRGPGGGDRGATRPPGGGTRGPGPQGDRHPPTTVYRNPGPGRGPAVNIYARPYYARPYLYSPSYYDRWARGMYGWSPLAYAPWAWIYGTAGYAGFGYAYGPSAYGPYGSYGAYGGYGAYEPYGGPYGYGMVGQATGFDTGNVRLKVRPRDAQVFVDGYYAGLVDDFDGSFQSLRLEQGGHKIEVRMPGYESLFFDVHVQPDHTLVLREDLRPKP